MHAAAQKSILVTLGAPRDCTPLPVRGQRRVRAHLSCGGRHKDHCCLLWKQTDIVCIHGLHPWRVVSGLCLSSNPLSDILHHASLTSGVCIIDQALGCLSRMHMAIQTNMERCNRAQARTCAFPVCEPKSIRIGWVSAIWLPTMCSGLGLQIPHSALDFCCPIHV